MIKVKHVTQNFGVTTAEGDGLKAGFFLSSIQCKTIQHIVAAARLHAGE